MSTLILFDVDATLLLTGGAGVRAMNRAIQELYGVSDGFEGIPMAGRTDRAIVAGAMTRLGRPFDDRILDRFRTVYCERLREEIGRPLPGKRVLPGVPELLAALRARPEVHVGLLTGNFAEGARVKLEHFALRQHFRFGAFGDDELDRNALATVARARAAELGLPAFTPDRIFVVGDTPLDVACALAAGVRSIGVATGPYDTAALGAAGAHDVFEDLRDAARFLRVIER